MAKRKQRRTTSRTKAPRTGLQPAAQPTSPPLQQTRVGGEAQTASRNRGLRWATPIAVGILIGSLIAWWVWTGRTGTGEVAVAQPIATISAPDYHSLLIDPADANQIFFGSHDGTQVSGDGGVSWHPGNLRGVDAMILASSPEAPETIYAAGHDVFQVSRDSGDTWQPVTHNLPGTDIHGFAQNPKDPQRLYAFVVGAGGFSSEDGGTTWSALLTQPPGGSYVVLASNGEELYAATDSGIARSRDHGGSWEQLETQPGIVTILSLAVSSENHDLIYVGTPSGAYRSVDGGSSWDDIGPAGVAVLSIALTPDDAERVLVLGNQGAVYRSDDSGSSWQGAND